MEEPACVQKLSNKKKAFRKFTNQNSKNCHLLEVVDPSQIETWKLAQQKLQKLIYIAKMCRSQQVNEIEEDLILVLKMNICPFSRALSDQYFVLHISKFLRIKHSYQDAKHKIIAPKEGYKFCGYHQNHIRLGRVISGWAVTVKENFNTKLHSADPRKLLSDQRQD